MRTQIIVAVVDTGIDYHKLKASVRDNLYWNHGEIAGNRRDDDLNGFVDDVTGPSTGPAWNHHYQAPSGGHGQAMVSDVSRQIDAATAILGTKPSVSIMPVSMAGHEYYANIVKAAQAGAAVISLSHNLNYEQKAFVSKILAPYDAIAVTVDRDTPQNPRPNAGKEGHAAYDNVLEVALVSDAIVKGNGLVDLLEVGSSLNNTSESHAIANAAGKIAAIWAVDPTRPAAEIVAMLHGATTRDHPTIQKQGLYAEMGGQIDLARGLALAEAMRAKVLGERDEAPSPAPSEMPAKTPAEPYAGLPRLEVDGYRKGTAADEVFVIGESRASAIGGGGDDVFLITARASREHVVRDFGPGDVVDVSALTAHARPGAAGHEVVRLQEASWGGSTHTRILVADEDGRFHQTVLLTDASGLILSSLIADDALVF